MSSDFVHLHVHSEYSLLDGMGSIKALVKQAAEHQQPALALTDHGVMHGAIEFYRACKSADIKPIIGMEAYMTPYGRKMTDRDPNRDKTRHHLLLLAQNMTGYRNLLKIASASQLEGYYYKPRIDADFLAAHSDGLICTSGCMAAEIPALLNSENQMPQVEQARDRLHWYLDVFGRDRFFIELQEHSIPELTRINKQLFEWSKREQLELLVTNDVHYPGQHDAGSHDTLLCVQTSSLVHATNRMRFSDESYYLKSESEMRAVFRNLADLPESAFTNSLKIAEMCEVDLEDSEFHLPDLPPGMMPPGYTYSTFLRHLTDEGLKWRYGREAENEHVQARKELELSIINTMHFDVYFLIVWDLCRFARENNIWWNVRGSGAGSIVAYALGITMIDPLQNNLIFERFLNPGRKSMPDFDLDYPDDQRERMIRYTIDTYGNDHVAQIVSFGRMKARAAIRDVGRAQGIDLSEVDQIAKLIPAIPGKPVTIDGVLTPDNEFYSPELEERYKKETQVQSLVDTARSLEGSARHASVHAAAVIITKDPLVDYVPLMKPQGSVITKSVTQFEYPVCESIGLLKVDFLGLSTLTIMRKAAELIKERYGKDYTLYNIPIEDPKAFELLSSGNVTGIFQVEGAGMRRILTEMRPSKFDHIIAAISLYRPGPIENIPTYIARMHGKEEVKYHHPDLEPILQDTYGILVYQEQIIRIASDLAGYEPGEADMIRKAVAKKISALMEKHRIQFTEGARARGYSKEVCEAIWGDIEYFARYGFNKAHAADYAVITCQTAYLKAHYPVEYMAALLTVEHNNTEKITILLEECRAMGIAVLPPDVNASVNNFTIETKDGQPAIRFGMGAIKNVGDGPIEAIMAAREEGAFADLADFCERVDLRKVGKRALESLIKVGAMDQFGERPLLLAIVDRMVRLSNNVHRAASVGQMTMFDLGGFEAPQTGSLLQPPPEVPETSRRDLLTWEKELIGAYISSHPLQPRMAEIRRSTTCLCGELDITHHGHTVQVAGLITAMREITTKKGKPMAFVTIEDIQASLEVVVFPRTFAESRDLLVEGEIILVGGKVDAKDTDHPKVLADFIDDKLTDHVPVEPQRSASNGRGLSLPATDAPPPDGPDLLPPDDDDDFGDTFAEPEAPPPLATLAAPPEPVATLLQNEPATTPNVPEATLPEPTRLNIHLPRSNNVEQDIERLRNVHALLSQHQGNTPFYLYIPQNGHEVKIGYDFQIDYNPQLASQLTALVGEDRVQVQR